MSKSPSKKDVLNLIQALATYDPKLFSYEKPVPFKVGIAKDVMAQAPFLKKPLIRRAFRDMTRRSKYLAACRAGAPRYDIHRQVCGVVTPAEAAYAQGQLAARKSSI